MNKTVKYTAIASVALIFTILSMDRMPQMITFAGLSAGCIYFITRKVNKDMRKKVVALFLTIFLLEVSFSLLMYNRTVDTEFHGFSHKGDDFSYGNFGTTVGDLWRRGIFPSLKELDYYNFITLPGGGVQNYQLYNAFVFYIFGACAGQILLIVNCFFHAAIIIPVYFICRDLNIRNNIMTFVFFLFLFWPSTLYWSLFNFKETSILFIFFTALALFTQIRENPRSLHILLFLIFLLIMYFLRRYALIIFPIAVLYFFIFKKWKYKSIVILTVLLVLLVLQLYTGIFSDLYIKLGDFHMKLYKIRFAAGEARSSYFLNFVTLTYPKTVLYFPIGAVATFFLPFLLRPFTLFQVGSNIESILWWCFLPFLAGGIRIAIRTELKKTFLFLCTFFCWLGMLALTQGNMGTLIRQKDILYYIGFIFIGLAIDRTLDKVQKTEGR